MPDERLQKLYEQQLAIAERMSASGQLLGPGSAQTLATLAAAVDAKTKGPA